MVRRLSAVCLGALCALVLFVVVLAQTAPFAGTATRGANLRSGPGTSYAVVGSLKAGEVVSVTKTNSDATWYQLDSGKWVAAFLVKPAASGAAKLAPSATVTATVAPKVTPTKVAATATPATPAPAAVKPTAEEVAAYLAAVGPASRDLGNAAGAFAQLFGKPQPGSNAWRVNLAMQIAAVQVAHEQLVAVKVPASMAAIHNATTAATAKCSEAVGLTGEAFDNGDIGALNRATKLMQECAAGVTEAEAMLNAVRQ